jgi:hypothetical protein
MNFKQQGLELRTKLFNLIRERSFKTGRVVHRWRQSGEAPKPLEATAHHLPQPQPRGLDLLRPHAALRGGVRSGSPRQ